MLIYNTEIVDGTTATPDYATTNDIQDSTTESTTRGIFFLWITIPVQSNSKYFANVSKNSCYAHCKIAVF